MNDYERVARVIRFLTENFREQPDLDALAEAGGLSPYHFHRLFRRWAGTTPKQFVQHLTAMEAGRLLRGGENVLDTALSVGLSGPGRLHDLCVKLEAASPGEIRSGGTGWRIVAGFAETPFGLALLATGPRGVCHLSFLGPDESRGSAWGILERSWPGAHFSRDDGAARETASRIFDPKVDGGELKVFVRGTEFQAKVWRSLVAIPPGEVRTYRDIAGDIGSPRGSRAVGSAVGSNPVAFLIPCHRVIHASGAVGKYRWGSDRKKMILAWENSRGIQENEAGGD